MARAPAARPYGTVPPCPGGGTHRDRTGGPRGARPAGRGRPEDARGHGDSGGPAIDLGWYGDDDITAAVTFVGRRPEIDAGRIGVMGLSMGGEEEIGVSAVDGRIQAVDRALRR